VTTLLWLLGIWGTVWLVVGWSRRRHYRLPQPVLAAWGVLLVLLVVGGFWWALTAQVSTSVTPFSDTDLTCGTWVQATGGGPFTDDPEASACRTASGWAGAIRLSLGAGLCIAVGAILRPPRHRAG